MFHRVGGRKLNRSSKHRKALFKGLANSVIIYEKIETTEAKAKAAKPFIEKLITLSKENTVNNRRTLNAKLGLRNSVDKLLEVVGPTFKNRPGGYLRITKLPPRAGDAAKMVVFEFVEEVSKPKEKITKTTKVSEKPKAGKEIEAKKDKKKVNTKVKTIKGNSTKVKNEKSNKTK